MNWTRPLALIAAGLLVQSCVAQAPDAKLLAAVSPSDTSEMSVSGALLKECFADNRGIASKLQPNSVAHFSQPATYKLAERMRRSPKDIAFYAERVRGYSFPYENTSVFGKRDLVRYCYYGKSDSNLTYLSSVNSDSVGSVQKEEFIGAIVDAYEKLSGKKLSFAQRAITVMSIPTQ